MNKLQLETGGRPVANDDFQVLQDRDYQLGLPALLLGLRPCVVSGCQLFKTGTQWNVSGGMVWYGRQLLDFDGSSNVTLPSMFVASPVEIVDERAYQTGGTKTTITAQKIALSAFDPAAGVDALVLNQDGAITFWHRLQEQTRELGTVEYVTDNTGYDVTGLGQGPKRGWALCNGQNKTTDLRGRFVLAENPAYNENISYRTVNDTGGEQTHVLDITEMPAHTHTHNARKDTGNVTRNTGGSNTANEGGAATINSAGGLPDGRTEAHNNMPPFYVLVARQWIGLN